MQILSESTPRLVRWVVAEAGKALLVIMSLLAFFLGYSAGNNGWIASFFLLDSEYWPKGLMVLATFLAPSALGSAMIVKSLGRPRKDFWIWLAIPLSFWIIGYAVEVSL